MPPRPPRPCASPASRVGGDRGLERRPATNRRPALDLEAGATVAPRGFYDPTITNLGEYRLLVGAAGTLADGGVRRRARAEAGLAATGAAIDEAQAARDAATRAVEVALALLQNGERVRQLEDALAWTTDLGSIVDAGVRAGRRGRADAVRVSLARDAANADLVAARGARGALLRELAELLDVPPGGRARGRRSRRRRRPGSDAGRLVRAPRSRGARAGGPFGGDRLRPRGARARASAPPLRPRADLARERGIVGIGPHAHRPSRRGGRPSRRDLRRPPEARPRRVRGVRGQEADRRPRRGRHALVARAYGRAGAGLRMRTVVAQRSSARRSTWSRPGAPRRPPSRSRRHR